MELILNILLTRPQDMLSTALLPGTQAGLGGLARYRVITVLSVQ
jgi:hypothetical protein